MSIRNLEMIQFFTYRNRHSPGQKKTLKYFSFFIIEKEYLQVYKKSWKMIQYLPIFTVSEKKTLPGTRDKSISNHRPGEKEKNYGSKRKKRPTSSDPLKKNQGIRSQWSKENQKPSANPAMQQLLKCSTQHKWSQL